MSPIAAAGLYIHIPFCKSRCLYCGFFSQTRYELAISYIDAVISEMHRYDISHLRTIYIGGGTPSSLGSEALGRLLAFINNNIKISDIEEFTIECNPDDIDAELAVQLKSAGVSRVSMGVQSTDDRMLQFLHRRHSSAQVFTAIEALHSADIQNINIDYIFGLPRFSWYDFEADFERFAAIETSHKSIYALSYEDGSPLTAMLQRGEVQQTDDNEVRRQYDYICQRMKALGYDHYEISNYARPGQRALHNSNYWRRVPYIGIGVAASSFWAMHRHTNNMTLADYVAAAKSGAAPIYENDDLSKQDVYNETVMLGLRTSDGVGKDELKALGDEFYRYFIERASHLQHRDGRFYLSEADWFISDYLVSNLFM